jgi:hypothetical protein
LRQQTGLISENAFRYPSLKMISPTAVLRHSNSCYAQAMAEEQPDASVAIDEYIESLKSRIPASEHGALDSRLEELLNDPNADEGDVIAILQQEFNGRR